MEVGDPFVRHTTYCFQVLEGLRTGEFSEEGLWPSREPADVDDPSQEVLIGQFMRWKELVKKYASVTGMVDPREMFILAVAVQRWPGPVLEIGTHKGITTCFLSEVMNQIKRRDKLFTVELFLESARGPNGEEVYPGDSYIKILQQFRKNRLLHRVVPMIGDSHEMHPIFWGIRPALIFLDGDHTQEGVEFDLSMLRFFNYPWICLVHQTNVPTVMEAVLDFRDDTRFRFVNFHTGGNDNKGLVAFTPI